MGTEQESDRVTRKPKTPTDEQTADKMTWKPGDLHWTKTPAVKKRSAAQRLADRVKKSSS